MNKIVVTGVSLLVAILLLFFILYKNRSPFGNDNSSFGSEPDKGITKIEFLQGEKKLLLEKKGDNWLLNGKTETRKTGILFILKILQEIKIKSPVSAELFKSEITDKGSIPVEVKVFEKRKLLKSFLVYKTNSNIYGNIMKIREKSKPFIVYIPGYEGDMGSAFTLNELFWQPYILFNLMPSEIASVKFENISDTASSFSILNNNHHSVLSGLPKRMTGWDSSLVIRYLSYFTRITFESWAIEMGGAEKKSIESQRPLYRLIVNTKEGKTTELTLWEIVADINGEKKKDTDRLLGKTQNSDELFVIRYFDIDPLLKKRSYFFHE
jgi:hypothetical protein